MNFLLRLSIIFSAVLSGLFFACASPPASHEQKTVEQKTVVPAKRVPIDSSGFTIELPATMKITNQKGGDFMVYYFTPIDTSVLKGEAGIYFGPKPDMHPPTTEYSQTEIMAPFLGQTEKWTQYVTQKYTQREVFIPNEDQKIHVWCYADNSEEMESLFKMVQSISR
jgi:hypothetical protein